MNADTNTSYIAVWDELKLVASHVKIHTTGDPALVAKAGGLLLKGWDHTAEIGRLDPPGFGVWRAPHLNILIDCCQTPGPAILATNMSVDEIASGLWRQLRIYPDCYAVESQDGDADLFRVSTNPDDDRGEAREIFIRSLIGQTVRDAAEYLVDLMRREPDIGRLVLAKDLKTALKRSPQLIQDDWPTSCHKRWKRTGKGRDLMPPVYFLALLYELARLAQNQAALLALSFDASGNEISVADLKHELGSLNGRQTPSPLADRLMRLASLQTTVAMPPECLSNDAPHYKQARWVEHRFQRLNRGFQRYGQTFARHMFDTIPWERPERAARRVISHPFLRPQPRAKQGESMRKTLAATYWSLNWRNHATAGLILIAQQARGWNARFRDAGSGPLNLCRASAPTGRDHSSDQAVSAISHFWLESFSLPALRTALRPVVRAQLDAELGKGVVTKNSIILDRRVEEAAEAIDVLAVNRHFGGKTCKAGRDAIAQLPKSGAEGYSALYHPHLWLGETGSDLAHYAKRASLERKRKTPNYALRDSAARANFAGVGGHFRNSVVSTKASAVRSDRYIAECAAQYLAMTVSSAALEPLRAVFKPQRD